MRTRDAARLFSIFAVTSLVIATVASCGGAGSTASGGFDASTFDGPGTFGQDDGSTGVSSCTRKTCAQQGFNCGPNGDTCGGQIACGSCSGSDKCGYGGFNVCGNPLAALDGGALCVPKTCADWGYDCGPAGDGCGNAIDCGPTTCPGTEFCGGGGPGKCGGDSTKTPDGGPVCTPQTCATLGYDCGSAGDGCGGGIGPCGPTGGTCTSPQFCGGGGPNKCGGNNGHTPDGGSAITCIPKTCTDLGYTCGVSGDGCGGQTALCGTCTSPQFCGGGGPSQCGGSNGHSADGGILFTCSPKTCADYGVGACGPQSDGCGGLTANCGTCTNPQFCGGGATPGKCGGNNVVGADGGGSPQCKPRTCATLGYNCGLSADGCGGIIGPCGPACVAPQACGAGGKANVCGSNIPCTGLCTQQVACASGSTTLTGTVVAGTPSTYLPMGVTVGDPVPNVLVYIPNGSVSAFTSRANETATQQCSTCGADVSGKPLVTTYSAYDGTFTLTNVPVGANIPVVIQLGRWRRQFLVNIATKCAPNTVVAVGATSNGNPIPAGYLVMPNMRSEGDIPLTAISTGNVDAMECVLLKMGVDPTEFTKNSGGGRIQMYTGNGANAGNNTPNEAALMDTGGTYNNYDQIILPCWGVDPVGDASNRKSATELADLVSYGSAGGHFFATHFSYTWLTQPWNPPNNGAFVATANWNVDHNTNIGSMTGIVNPLVPPTTPGTFVDWLNKIQALSNFTAALPPPNPADVSLSTVRHDVDSVAGKSVDWIDGTDPGDQSQMLLHFTFDTPVNQASQCGHAIFSDFHVTNSNATKSFNFTSAADRTSECGAVPMTPQEKVLEYMIWDLASCVPPAPTSTCVPKTCANFPGTCGVQGDGCGGLTANCGACGTGQACGGAGVANQCGIPDGGPCAPETCAVYPVGTCGEQSDGCGSLTANCSNCPAGQACGGGGTPGVCGAPPSGSCAPVTCAAYVGICGKQTDGCGGLTPDCNPCPAGQTCGGGGTLGMCGAPPAGMCTPTTCPAQMIECGPAGDGCGSVIPSCGVCVAPQTCGGGGVPGKCGGSGSCTPVTCASQNIACGPAGDGCGNLIASCGPCVPPATCGGGGIQGQCGGGAACVPKTCQELHVNCGPSGDGCGGLIPTCGTCTGAETCGGGGAPGQCGAAIQK